MAPVGNGSLFPQVALAGGAAGGWRPLFEDRRARQVGDTLTVSIEESTSASKAGGKVSGKFSGCLRAAECLVETGGGICGLI